MQTSKTNNSISPLHIAVLMLGLLVFVLLFLADKSNLNDDSADSLANSSRGTEKVQKGPMGDDLLSIIPPAEPSDELAATLTALEGATNADERRQLLQALVNGFRDAGRQDVAAVYAGMLAREVPDIKNFIVAGALFRNAAQKPELQADTTVFRRFSDEAIRYLESALELDSDNEDAKIELGLAMV